MCEQAWGKKVAPCTLLHIHTEVDMPHEQEIAPLGSGRTQILLDVAVWKKNEATKKWQ